MRGIGDAIRKAPHPEQAAPWAARRRTQGASAATTLDSGGQSPTLGTASQAEGHMAQVEIYSTLFCPYCARAKSLLDRKGVMYVNIDVMEDPSKRDEMLSRAGGRTSVPQIFIDGEYIGGSDELAALDRAGKLDQKLGLATPGARPSSPPASSPTRP